MNDSLTKTLQSTTDIFVNAISKVQAYSNKAWSNPLLLGLVIGLATVAIATKNGPGSTGGAAGGVLIAGAAFAGGAILGFIFGIPRVLQESNGSQQRMGRGGEPLYKVNTNFELISDWLTKIIIALGLAQLTKLPEAFMSLATYVAPAISTESWAVSISSIVLAYFGVIGFLSAYLWTRLMLTIEFTRADRSAQQSPEFYEGYVHALLYQPAPEGFELAIENGLDYIKRFGEGNWRIWRSLACGYAQQYGHLRATSGDQVNLKTIRDKSLDALKHALAIAPGEKMSLRGLWIPGEGGSQESDLAVFYGDPGFKQLLATARDTKPPRRAKSRTKSI